MTPALMGLGCCSRSFRVGGSLSLKASMRSGMLFAFFVANKPDALIVDYFAVAAQHSTRSLYSTMLMVGSVAAF